MGRIFALVLWAFLEVIGMITLEVRSDAIVSRNKKPRVFQEGCECPHTSICRNEHASFPPAGFQTTSITSGKKSVLLFFQGTHFPQMKKNKHGALLPKKKRLGCPSDGFRAARPLSAWPRRWWLTRTRRRADGAAHGDRACGARQTGPCGTHL